MMHYKRKVFYPWTLHIMEDWLERKKNEIDVITTVTASYNKNQPNGTKTTIIYQERKN